MRVVNIAYLVATLHNICRPRCLNPVPSLIHLNDEFLITKLLYNALRHNLKS